MAKQPGHPTKFDQTMRDAIMALAGGGATDAEICKVVGICPATLYLWKNKIGGNFRESLLAAKNIANDLVVCALLDNAINKGNVTAQIFWLKNRMPDQWRDRFEFKEDVRDKRCAGIDK